MLLAVFNDGAMIALSKDRVVASPTPNSWNLKAIFISGIVYGLYLTASTWALFFTASKTQVHVCRLPCLLFVHCLEPSRCVTAPANTANAAMIGATHTDAVIIMLLLLLYQTHCLVSVVT